MTDAPAGTAPPSARGRRAAPTAKGAGARGPKAKRTGWRRFVPSWKLVLASVFAFILLGVGAVAVAYRMTDIPQPNELVAAQTSIVYWNDGSTEMDRIAERNRISVDLQQVPEHVRQAVVAAEDRGFYENSGISPTGIARAAWNNFTGGDTQGGSTITQQYVKNYYLTQDRTVRRKVEEIFVSAKIDGSLTKDTILQDYLNTIYFGRGAYGIETGAQAYFGKSVRDLTVEEGAALASVIASPSRYDPRLGPEAAARLEQRFRYTLGGMAEVGAYDPAVAATAVLPAFVEYREETSAQGQSYYMVEAAKAELATAGITPEQIQTEGLRITTTFDQKAQAAAETAVAEQLPTEGLPPNFHAALAAVRPGTGEVVALYGGAGVTNDGVDNEAYDDDALRGNVQAGSTFKPFALAAALEKGVSLKSRFDGADERSFPEYENGRPVPNFDGDSFGTIDLVKATESSVNTVFVDLTINEATPEGVVDAATRAGIPADTGDLIATPSVVLGVAYPHPVDLANAYATFAANGEAAQRHVVQKVTDPSGAVLYEGPKTTTQAFEPDVVADVSYALQRVVTNGSGREARKIDRASAGKTGTTNSNRSALYAGYTPQLAAVAALWTERPELDEGLQGLGGLRRVNGGSIPAKIWTAFMAAALDGEPELDFPERADVGDAKNTPTPTPTPTETAEPEPSQPAPEPAQPAGVGVPSTVGQEAGRARNELRRAGFEVAVAVVPVPDKALDGRVVGQDPGGGTLEAGRTVTITIGRYEAPPPTATVPPPPVVPVVPPAP